MCVYEYMYTHISIPVYACIRVYQYAYWVDVNYVYVLVWVYLSCTVDRNTSRPHQDFCASYLDLLCDDTRKEN